jgi:hypothetical protein
MWSVAEPKKPLARFDEHGMFELAPEITEQIGGGIKVWPTWLVKRLGPDENGNRICRENVICADVSCG